MFENLGFREFDKYCAIIFSFSHLQLLPTDKHISLSCIFIHLYAISISQHKLKRTLNY